MMSFERIRRAAVLGALFLGACSSQDGTPGAGPAIPEPEDAIVSCGPDVPYTRLQTREPVDPLDPAWIATAALMAAYPGEFSYLPSEGWIVMKRTEQEAVFGILQGRGSELHVDAVEASFTDDEWRGAGSVSGGCTLRVVLPEELTRVDWELDHRMPNPGPAATELHLLANEGCSFGDLADRLRTPTVKETDEQVLVALAADSVWRPTLDRPIGGDVVEVEIALGEPLGDRAIVDGLALPDPTATEES